MLSEHLTILESKDLGGNILQFLCDGIVENFCNQDDQTQQILRIIFSLEDHLLAYEGIQSDFKYIVAGSKFVSTIDG